MKTVSWLLVVAISLGYACNKKKGAQTTTEIVATVDGVEISYADFRNHAKVFARSLGKETLSGEEKQQVLERLIHEQALYSEGRRRELDRGDVIIRRRVIQRLIETEVRQTERNTRPTEAELKDYYQGHPDLFTKPETVRISQLLLQARKPDEKTAAKLKIELLHKKVRASPNLFEPIAAKESDDRTFRSRGGELTLSRDRARQAYGDAFEKVVFEMAIGSISDPISTPIGWHLIKLLERRPAELTPFEGAKNRALALLMDERKEAQKEALAKQLMDNSHVVVDKQLLAKELKFPSFLFQDATNQLRLQTGQGAIESSKRQQAASAQARSEQK